MKADAGDGAEPAGVPVQRERDATLDAASGPDRARQRPDSSVVEHLHGKEKVKSSILFRGSDTPLRTPRQGVLAAG